MAYYTESWSERGKPTTKYGSEFVRVLIDSNRVRIGELYVDGKGVSYRAEGGETVMIDPSSEWPEKAREVCYKCGRAAKYITHSDKNGNVMPHARFTCEEHHYSD